MTATAYKLPDRLPSEVPCLLIPMVDRPLVLPNVAVAEIIAYIEPTPDHATPDWHLGTIVWRGVSVPLISFEAINGRKIKKVGDNVRIAIINGVGDHPELPFYAFVVEGIPRLLKVFDEEIAKEDTKTAPAEFMFVQVGGELAVIPELDFIEGKILGR